MYSLTSARRGTHLKIIAFAVICSTLICGTFYASKAAHPLSFATTIQNPQAIEPAQVVAHSVCSATLQEL